VGVLSLAGKVPRVLVTPTDDLGVVLNAVHGISMEGTVNFPTGVQVRSRDEAPDTRASPSPDPRRDRRLGSLSSRSVAFFFTEARLAAFARARDVRLTAARRSPPSPDCRQVAHLALKHRQNKHQRMRIVLFIGSPVEAETSELISVGKKLRKCNVAVDVVSFGDVDENAEKLEAFMGAVNKNNNSNLVTVPPGANLADVLLSTPIFMDEDSGGGSGFAAAAAAASSHAAMQGFDGGDAMMDGGDDPALALALRVSLEEERARQEAAAAAANGGDAEPAAGAAPAEAEAKTPAAEAPAAGAAAEDVAMMDEDALLQRAFALSMGGEGGAAGGGEDDPALQAALAMSMQEDQAGGSGAGAADPLADANYVNSILSSLPGVDPNDPSIQQALQGDAEKKEEEGEEKK
jgi:26S proteasome regulatory subunit N10